MSTQSKDWPANAARIGHGISGWSLIAPVEIVRAASRLDRKTLAWGAIALGAILLLSVNLLSSLLFKNVKADLTQDRLFTISDGTKRVLSKMDEPVNVRLYYTKKLGEVAPLYGKYFERVKALLEQYRDLSNGKMQLALIEPESFSDAEDRAVAAGLRGVRLNQDGETGYFGLVASNTTDNDAVVEFFSPDRERFLEYDLTKLVNGLANPKKRVIGLIAGIPIEGGAGNPMQPMRQPPPAWMVMDQIREFFEVRTLQADLKEIPADIDVLMLAQPQGLTPDATYAIDQFALKGGRILAFVDPVPETSPSAPMGMGMQMPSPGPDAELVKLLKTWGVSIDPAQVAGDPALARRVQFGGGRRPTVTDYLGWLQIDKPQINEKDVLAASIERLNFASSGILTKVEGATTDVTPIIETTARGGPLQADKLRFQPDPIALLKDFKSGGTPLMLAARVGGEAKTAFPDGRPKPAPKPEDTASKDAKDEATPSADATKAGETAKTEPAKADATKAAETTKSEPAKAEAAKAEPPGKPEIASGKVNIVVVADSDMLNDQFWVEARDFMGQQVAVPLAHNAAFVVNALENLSGGEALAGLRGRGINDRPFERVSEIRRDAERRFREKEQTLVAQLKELQEKVGNMETKGGEGGTLLLSDKDKQTIEAARTEMIGVRRELRDVKLALRQDIDRLGGWLKFFNVAAIPLVIGFGGLAIGLAQRRRKPQA
jgi:ABC-type uncharacterized transport system involved in gliding motility auxiliary subunit